MADMADRSRLIALETKKKLIGDFMRRRQEFQGIRNLEDNLQKMNSSFGDLDKAIKKGNARNVEKAEQDLVKNLDGALENIGLVMVDLIYDAHLIKESLIIMQKKEHELRKLNAPEKMTKMLEIKHAEGLKKIDETLRRVASLAIALENSEE